MKTRRLASLLRPSALRHAISCVRILCLLASLATLCALAQSPSAPVVLDGKTVITLNWGFGNNTPSARAAGIAARLQAVAQNHSTPITITQQEGEITIDIRCGQTILASLYSGDAQAANITREALAQQWSDSFTTAMQDYREKYGWRVALYHGSLALLGMAACIVAYLLVRRRSRSIASAVTAFLLRHSGDSSHVHVASQLSTTLRQNIVRRLLTLLELLLLALAAVLAVDALLILFPTTRPIVIGVYNGIAQSTGSLFGSFWTNLPALLFVLILAILLSQLIRLIRYFFARVEEGAITIESFRPSWSAVTGRLVNIAVVVLAMLIAYPYVPGSQSPAFKGISLFLGVLVSLGSTGLVANIISGVMLTYMDAFAAGDLVKIGDITAFVKNTSLLTTRLVTRHNETITVPNSFILDKHVVNYNNCHTGERGLLISTSVGVGYDVSWQQAEAILLEAAARTESLLKDPAPFVLVPSLDIYNAVYEINAYLKPGVRRYIGLTDLHHNVLDLFNEYGISLMTPSYRADPPIPKVVSPENWYAPPAKREQPAPRKYPPADVG